MNRFLLPHAAVAFLLLATAAPAADVITVTLRSGRTFTAAVDPRTDEDRLWLRFGEGSTVLLRPVAWEAVVGAWRDGQPVEPEQLRREAESLWETEEQAETAPLPQPDESAIHFEPLAPHPGPPPRVASVAFDAHLANFDADAEADGLIVVIRPLDSWGRLVAAEGTVEVELIGAVRRTFHSAPRSGGAVHQTLGRWTKSLHAAVPAPDGYLFKLPFPGRDGGGRLAASRGRVRVRLVVPGCGVFEDEREGTPIAPFTPLADSAAGFIRD
jgi:catechol 2,3-dioxygenase-like lactoylglutathione lyase family enzyme